MLECKTSIHLSNCFSLLGQAEYYIDVDGDSATIKLRKSLEALISHIAYCSDISDSGSRNAVKKLESLINDVFSSNYFGDNYKTIKRKIKELQTRLNDGSHYNERLFVVDAEVKCSWVLLRGILQDLIDNRFIENLFVLGGCFPKKKAVDKDYLEYCKKQSLSKIRLQRYGEAITYLENGLRLSGKTNEKMFFLYYLAYSNNEIAQYDKANHFAELGFYSLIHANDLNRSIAFLSQIIRALSQSGKHKECISLYLEYEHYFTPSQNAKNVFSNNLGWLYNYLFKSLFHLGGIYEVEKSKYLMGRAIKIFEETKDSKGSAIAYTNLGQIYTYYTNQHSLAVSCFEKARKYAGTINDSLIASVVDANYCVEFLSRIDYAPELGVKKVEQYAGVALRLIEGSVDNIKSRGLDNTTFIVDEYMHLAECRLACGDYFGAEESIKKSRKIMDAYGLIRDERRSGRVVRVQANVYSRLPGISVESVLGLFDLSCELTQDSYKRNHLESLIDKEKYLKRIGLSDSSVVEHIRRLDDDAHYPIYEKIIELLKV